MRLIGRELGMHRGVWRTRRYGLVAVAFGVVSAAVVATSVGAVRTDGTAQSNPNLAASCGTDVVVILDESASIDSDNATGDVAEAVQALVAGLTGTGSRMRIVEFSTNARDAEVGGSTAFRTIDDDFADDVDEYLNGAGATTPTQNAATYHPWLSTTGNNQVYTNWEAALRQAWTPNQDNGAPLPSSAADGTPLVVFVTDGDPNTVGTSGSSNGGASGEDAARDAAIQEMAALQAAGTHVLSIAVGAAATSSASYGRLTNLTEPGTFEQWTGTGTLDLRTVDALRVDEFDDLLDALEEIVYALCGSSITITKLDNTGAPVPGWDFDLTVQSMTGGTALEWESPTAGTAAAPSVRTGTTTGSGAATFAWTPGSLASPQPWSSTVTFEETLDPGWTVDVSPAALEDGCTVQREGIAPFTVDLRQIAPVGIPAPGSTVRFGLKADNTAADFTVGHADIVSCEVVNIRPVEITVVKDASPDSALDFGFTIGSPDTASPLPAPFLLDDDADPQLPRERTFLFAPGNFTITEAPAGAGEFWRLAGVTCTFDAPTGDSRISNLDLAARTVQLALSGGAKVRCEFDNLQVPPPRIGVTKQASTGSFVETAGAITYDLSVSNPGSEPVQVTSIIDQLRLNGADRGVVDLSVDAPASVADATLTANSCRALVATWLAPGASVPCSFTLAYEGRDAGDDLDDTITVTGVDGLGRTPPPATADAHVEVTDDVPTIGVQKSNAQTSITAPGGIASWIITWTNQSATESLEIVSVADALSVDRAGAPVAFEPIGSSVALEGAPATWSVAGFSGCEALLGQVLAPGATSAPCELTVDTTQLGVDLLAGDQLRNLVSLVAVDDDGNQVPGADDAVRPVVLSDPLLDVWKSDGQATSTEPGSGPEGRVTYTIWIDNVGEAGVNGPIEITDIVDDVYFADRPAAPGIPATAVGSIHFSGAADSPVVQFTRPGVVLVASTCQGLIGRVLEPATAMAFVPGVGLDEARRRPVNAAARAECTIELQLPGNSGDLYGDVVTVSSVDAVSGDPLPPMENTATTPVAPAPPAVSIGKVATPDAIDEPGGQVSFELTIRNDSSARDPIVVTSLVDSVFGDLLAPSNPLVTDNACRALVSPVAVWIEPGASATCSFSGGVWGNVGNDHVNTVTVVGTDDDGAATPPSLATESVTFRDLAPAIAVTKTAIAVGSPAIAVVTPPAQVSELGDLVTYEVGVTNPSNEPVLLTSLLDDRFGDLAGRGSCLVTDGSFANPVNLGRAIAPGATYTCTFTAHVAQAQTGDLGPDDLTHVNRVDAVAVDDEGGTATAHDTESVAYVQVPPSVDVDKSDLNASVDEPGGDVVFHVTIENPLDAAEPLVAITSLTDTVTFADRPLPLVVDLLGAPTGDLVANTCPAVADAITATTPLVPGTSVACEFTLHLTGTSQLVRDVVAIVALDNDGQPAGDADDESTPIDDVVPGVRLVKTAAVPEVGIGDPVEYTFEIWNTSVAEPLFVIDLTDDRFGNLSAECGYSVDAPVELARAAGFDGDGRPTNPGAITSCTIARVPAFGNDGVHTNVATVSGADDEILAYLRAPTVEQQPRQPVTDTDDETVLAVRHLDVGFVVQECIADSPYIRVDIDPIGFVPAAGAGVTLRYFSAGMELVRTDAAGNLTVDPSGTPLVVTTDVDGAPLVPSSDQLVFWPGASLSPLDWPGWKLEAGEWVPDETDAFVRDGLFVEVSVNPTELTQLIPYPPATPDCPAGPPVNPPGTELADLGIVKSSSVGVVAAGGSFEWTLDVTNHGPGVATGVVVSDLVPTGLVVGAVTSNQLACTAAGRQVTCVKASMAAGETARVAIAVTVPSGAAAGDIVNIGSVAADTPDPDMSNNVDDAVVTMVGQNPPVPPAPPAPQSTPPLPRTGADIAPLVQTAMMLVGTGLVLVLNSRRRSASRR